MLKTAPDNISINFLLRNKFLKNVCLEQLYMLMYIYNHGQDRYYFSMEFFARTLRRSEQTVSNHFKELADMNLIERIKNKKYYMTKLTKYFYNLLGFYAPGEEENVDIVELFKKVYKK